MQPCELRIFHDRLQQRVAGDAAVDALVGGAFPVEQRLVQMQKCVA
jgi:hypothetical protein